MDDKINFYKSAQEDCLDIMRIHKTNQGLSDSFATLNEDLQKLNSIKSTLLQKMNNPWQPIPMVSYEKEKHSFIDSDKNIKANTILVEYLPRAKMDKATNYTIQLKLISDFQEINEPPFLATLQRIFAYEFPSDVSNKAYKFVLKIEAIAKCTSSNKIKCQENFPLSELETKRSVQKTFQTSGSQREFIV